MPPPPALLFTPRHITEPFTIDTPAWRWRCVTPILRALTLVYYWFIDAFIYAMPLPPLIYACRALRRRYADADIFIDATLDIADFSLPCLRRQFFELRRFSCQLPTLAASA